MNARGTQAHTDVYKTDSKVRSGVNLLARLNDQHCDEAVADVENRDPFSRRQVMSHHKATEEIPLEQQSTLLSFEVSEVVSLLAAFEKRIAAPQAGTDEDYDPFAPGFPGVH